MSVVGDHQGSDTTQERRPRRPARSTASRTLPTHDPTRRWTLSDLLWLLDGEWEVTAVGSEIVVSRENVAVVIDRKRGIYRAATTLFGLEYNFHQSVTLRGALEGVRRDLRREAC